MFARRATLLIILFSAAASITLAYRDGGSISYLDPADMYALPVRQGDRIGPFVFDGTEVRNGLSLRLLSPSCDGVSYVTQAPAAFSQADKFDAFRFPPAEWSTHFVYRGEAIEGRPDFAARAGAILARARQALLGHSAAYAEIMVVMFHTPVGCAFDKQGAIEVARELGRRVGRVTSRE